MRKKHNVEVRDCKAFSFSTGHKIYFGLDNDLPSYLEEVSKSIDYSPRNKNPFGLNTSLFVNGEEEINEYGLVAMSFVIPKKKGIKHRFNSVFLLHIF